MLGGADDQPPTMSQPPYGGGIRFGAAGGEHDLVWERSKTPGDRLTSLFQHPVRRAPGLVHGGRVAREVECRENGAPRLRARHLGSVGIKIDHESMALSSNTVIWPTLEEIQEPITSRKGQA